MTSCAEYRMDEHFQNLSIFGILSFPNWKNSGNLLIFQLEKFHEFPTLKIQQIFCFKNKPIT